MRHIVYPRELDGAIESEIRKLKDRYVELLGDKQKNSSVKLNISEEETVKYYDDNSLEYYKATAFVAMSDIYKKGSSAESVEIIRFRQLAKFMI
jgi:hypothetical protein